MELIATARILSISSFRPAISVRMERRREDSITSSVAWRAASVAREVEYVLCAVSVEDVRGRLTEGRAACGVGGFSVPSLLGEGVVRGLAVTLTAVTGCDEIFCS